MIELISRPWPWYVAGPLIGLMVPILLIVGNKSFGMSANFRHVCAACWPMGADHFKYDWKRTGGWNLALGLGVVIGGAIAGTWLASPGPMALSQATLSDLTTLGITDFSGIVPREIFSWEALATWKGFLLLIGGGFLCGFGSAYAGGCSSGHGIAGLAALQLASLIAVIGFFAGGVISTHFILPLFF